MIPAVMSFLIFGAQTVLLNGAGERAPDYSNALSGRIFDSRTGAPGSVLGIQASVVVLVPEISRPERSDLHKAAPVGAQGRFSIEGVAPGRYRIFATRETDPNAYRDPVFIARAREAGQPVVLVAGDRLTIDLR